MSATLQPGAVCASLDNGKLFVVDSIAGEYAMVRPIEDPKVPPIECPAIAALQHARACYQRHFDSMPVAWQTVDDIAADAINQAAGMPSAGVLFAALAALVRDLEKFAPKLGPLRSIGEARRLVTTCPRAMHSDDLWPLMDSMP